jgi:hypothetical protein
MSNCTSSFSHALEFPLPLLSSLAVLICGLGARVLQLLLRELTHFSFVAYSFFQRLRLDSRLEHYYPVCTSTT